LTEVTIRPMRPEDLLPAVDAIREGGWGERLRSFEFFLAYPAAHPFVAESDGKIVGTSVATQNGSVGWVGLVFVSPAMRGLGRDLTAAALDCFDELGCRSVVLAATELGRPVYERLGFVVDGGYVILSGPPRSDAVAAPRSAHADPRGAVIDPRLRALTPGDLAAVAKLDRDASAEDRSGLIRAAPEGWVLDDAETIRGYALRTPWGLGPAIARDPSDGAVLLEVLRSRATGETMTLSLATENTAAVEYLRRIGFEEQRHLPRMVRGDPVPWTPEHIWTIFSFALG
jgi:GNAT superfamily N-acetyltransferase